MSQPQGAAHVFNSYFGSVANYDGVPDSVDNLSSIPEYATALHLDISTPNYIEHTTSGGHDKRGIQRNGFVIDEFYDAKRK